MLTLDELVAWTRKRSPFYARHYQALPEHGWQLTDLPLIDPAAYWRMEHGLDGWDVLSGPLDDGLIFKTGGTTGSGKISVYTREEWRNFVSAFGRGLSTLLKPGDRIANLFFCGDLYASLLFIHGAIAHINIPVCEFPFSGQCAFPGVLAGLRAYGINVIVGVPGRLLQFAAWLAEHGECLPQIDRLLYGSESLFDDQLALLYSVFPNVRCASIGCASVDAGLIGASTPDCQAGEHRCFERETRVEIVDESTGESITQCNRPGMLVVTNLQRKLMPLIRYPVGDQAAWVEDEGCPQRKFTLLGRSSLGHRIRLGYASLFPDDIDRTIVATFGACRWQMVIDYLNATNILTIRLARPRAADLELVLIENLVQQCPALGELQDSGQLIIDCHWCDPGELALNPRTGKLLRVVDLRQYQPGEKAS